MFLWNAKCIGVISKVKHMLSESLLTILYYTMVYPHLSYCNIIWGGASKLVLNRLTTLQKRAVRVIGKVKSRTSTSELFKKFNILRLHDVYKLSLSMFMYKLIHGLLPQCCYYLYTY